MRFTALYKGIPDVMWVRVLFTRLNLYLGVMTSLGYDIGHGALH